MHVWEYIALQLECDVVYSAMVLVWGLQEIC